MSTERFAPRPVSVPAGPSDTEAAVAPVPSPSIAHASLDTAPLAVALPPTMSPAHGVSVGGMLRHFRVDKRIASGGMGDVYLGFDTSLQRPVALKTIRAELARDPVFLSRFTREAIAQANVVHPHVVQVYFVGEDQGVWFLAMQVVDGGSLQDVLDRDKPTLSWQAAARHMRDLASGLVVAERLGIVHRDIKPANVLVDHGGRALLADFGLASSAGQVERAGSPGGTQAPAATGKTPAGPSGSQPQLAQVTEVGVIMGTPDYVAPEQLKPGTPVDARADIFALGGTFFHLLSGQPPSNARTLLDAMARFAEGKRAPPLATVAPRVPRSLARVIDRCLALEPDARFASMQDLLDALGRVQPQPIVRAGPIVRLLAWLIDVVPLAALMLLLYERAAWAPPVLFFVAGALGAGFLRSTPGIWLLRLRLRTGADTEVTGARVFVRFLIQHGGYVLVSIGLSALYASSSFDVLLLAGAAWLGLIALGSLAALSRRGQALHDLVTNTRVLVDTRWRDA